MTSYAFSIAIAFQIWACHMIINDKLYKNFILPDALLIKYEVDICIS